MSNSEILKKAKISIHVPAWGTTNGKPYSCTCWTISIHVPAWGTTKIKEAFLSLPEISIHVPAWGTTLFQNLVFTLFNFNPRSRVGNDGMEIITTWTKTENFNPRSRVGNDVRPVCIFSSSIFISIHVPAWGTTNFLIPITTRSNLFQSTFPRGERQFIS